MRGHNGIHALQRLFQVNIAHKRIGVSTDVDDCCGNDDSRAYRCAGEVRRLLHGLSSKKLNSGRLLRNVEAGHDLECGEIDYLYRAGF